MARAATTPQPTTSGQRALGLRRLRDSSDNNPRVGAIVGPHTTPLGEVIGDVVSAGIGILISPTRDLGAISITLYVGDDRERAYASSAGEFGTLLEAVRDIATSRLVSGSNG